MRLVPTLPRGPFHVKAPPTETLSLFLSPALSADRSCQRAVNEAAVKRLIGGLPRVRRHGIRGRLSKCHSPQG